MPTYDDATKKMPSLAEMLMAARARRQANPGQRPPDATGPALVTMQGRAPIQAQMVGAPKMVDQGSNPYTNSSFAPVVRQGPTKAQIQQMLADGKIDPRMAQMMLKKISDEAVDQAYGGAFKTGGM